MTSIGFSIDKTEHVTAGIIVYVLHTLYTYVITADVSGNHVLELKLKALILDQIHAIDVIDHIMSEGVSRCEQWEWNKQLRYSYGYILAALLTLYKSRLAGQLEDNSDKLTIFNKLTLLMFGF